MGMIPEAINRGAVYVLLMNSDGTVKSSQKIAHQTGGGPTLADGDDFSAFSVSSLGDLDGDGVSDLAVGAQMGMIPGEMRRGAVYVLLMNTDGTGQEFTEDRPPESAGGRRWSHFSQNSSAPWRSTSG